MKKTAIILAIIAWAAAAQGQDTIDIGSYFLNICNGTEYRYTPDHQLNNSHRIGPLLQYYELRFQQATPCYTVQPQTIFGMLVPIINWQSSDATIEVDIRPVIFQKVEGARYRATYGEPRTISNLYSSAHDGYIKIRGHYPSLECDRHTTCQSVCGAYYLYFEEPVTVVDTFYYAVTLGYPISGGDGMTVYGGRACVAGPFSGCQTLDFAPWRRFYPEDEAYEMWTADTSSRVAYIQRYADEYTYPAIALLTEPMGMDECDCPEMGRVVYMGDAGGYPYFEWDREREFLHYEFCYGLVGADMDEMTYDTCSANRYTICDTSLREGVPYQAMVRAQCRHACAFHDTVMWTDWSAPSFFNLRGRSIAASAERGEGTLFTLTPNPASGQVTVEVAEGCRDALITLHDNAGHEVLRQTASDHRTALSLKGLPTGVYYVTLTTPKATASQKLVIEY